MEACKFWLTFSVTFTSSDIGRETCSATTFSCSYAAESVLKSTIVFGSGISALTPSARSASTNVTWANRLGCGTAYLYRIEGPPRGNVPVNVCLCDPSAFVTSEEESTLGFDPAGPVVI